MTSPPKSIQLKLNAGFFGVLVKYFDGWATVILPVHETVQPKSRFAHKLQQNAWENTQMTITQWPHAPKSFSSSWCRIFFQGICEVFWWVGHGHTACSWNCAAKSRFAHKLQQKRLRKHTNVYHAMTSCTKKHQLKLNRLLWGTCEVFWWVGYGHTACSWNCAAKWHVLRTNSNKTPEKTHKCLSRNDLMHRKASAQVDKLLWGTCEVFWWVGHGHTACWCNCAAKWRFAHKLQQNAWENTQMSITQWPHAPKSISSSWIRIFFGVLVKYFDGWATVILPVDVTVQQSGVLRTNSNKTPEKTHKCLSRNDLSTKKLQLKLNKLLWGTCEVFWWVSHGHTACWCNCAAKWRFAHK